MKTIKRILALVPAVLVLLWCVVPFGSMAAIENKGDYPEAFFDAFPDIDFLQSEVCESSSYVLIYYVSDQSALFDYPSFRTRSIYIPLNTSLLVDNGSGIYSYSTIPSNSSLSRFYYQYTGIYLAHPSYPINSGFDLTSGSYHSITSFSIDSVAEDVVLNGTIGKEFVADNVSYNVIHFDFVIDGESVGSDEIEVDTFPKLEGDTTLNIYQLDDKGYKVKDTANTYLSLQTFQIDITNNSDKSFQYACYIMPKGESLTYHSNYSDILGSRFFSNNPTFIYITDEIFYNYLGTDNPTSPHYNNQYRIVYAPSSWHLIEAGASESVYIGENQLQLKKDIEYDIVILGVFTEYGEIIDGTLNNGLNMFFPDNSSLNSIVTGIDPYVTFYSEYEVKEYYRSTFSLDKDTSYCNTQYSNDGSFDMVNTHVYPYNPNTSNDEVFNTIYGQSFEGETSYHNNVFNPNYNGAHVDYPGSNPGINNNFGSGVSLTSGFNSFFGMITDLLKHLPGPFLSIFIFGFSSIVVIAIIKAVKS